MQLHFPNLLSLLRDEDFKSKSTGVYNCVGYALGDPNWWDASREEGQVWPDDLPKNDYSIDKYLEVFRRKGFTECDGPEPEQGYEKLAVFGMNGEFEHVAIQLTSGVWISKLGGFEDIEHPSASAMEGGSYGSIHTYLKREGEINRVDRFPLT